MQNKISFVLPFKNDANTYGKNLLRLKNILLPSLKKFFDFNDVDKFLIIAPDDECQEILSYLNQKKDLTLFKITIVSETEVLNSISGWKLHEIHLKLIRFMKYCDRKFCGNKLMHNYRSAWYYLDGWYRQQLLKLFAAKFIRTPQYVTLDADICLGQEANYQTLLPGGKAIYTPLDLKESSGLAIGWYETSRQMLGYTSNPSCSDIVMHVTPEILWTDVVNNLLDHLKKMASQKRCLTIFEYLSSKLGWTEYSLYWVFLCQNYNKEDYYCNNTVFPLDAKNSVWFKENARNKEELKEYVDRSFQEKSALFFVLQSNSLPADDCIEVLKDYLDSSIPLTLLPT
ncbi:DUF6492 family protein [Planctomycetota bacterium]